MNVIIIIIVKNVIRTMENFQLYRTNLFLGGQMKWDIIISSNNSSLLVSDFHLSPISNNIPYVHKTDEQLLNNTHQDNVKLYYNSIKGNFYNEGLDSIFNHNWPILCKEGEVLNAYSNIYDMGCKRMKSYNLYKKQFEFFCPLWIEHINKEIEFRFIAKPKNSDIILSSKRLNFNITNNIQNKFHNKFVKYFNEYINKAELNTGDDNLLKVLFKDHNSYIYGLDANTGEFTSKLVNYLIDNMLIRERPLLETDNMLIQTFVNNTIVAKQLFNFNFCFNLEDIMSENVINMLSGESIVVSIETYIDGKKLEKRDFYTNYEFIERCAYGDNNEKSFNVLDYLHDNKSIEMINKNKFCQPICHWSLVENNDYIFNVYEGFSGIRVEDDCYFENLHQYRNASNLNNTSASNASEITWINTERITTWNAFYKYIINTEKNKKRGSCVYENNFINNLKYKEIPRIEVEDYKGLYIIGLYVNKTVYTQILNNIERFELVKIPIDDSLIILRKENLLMIVTIDINKLTFKEFYNILINEEKNIYDKLLSISNNLQKEKIYIDALYSLTNNVISPELIKFDGGLLWTTTKGPSNNVSEIEYIKNNSIKNYVLRYDGKLKPTFVSEPKNVIYYKDYVSNDKENSKLVNSKYLTYMNTGFEPNYPSLDYYAINSISEYNYDDLPIGDITEHGKHEILNDLEYSWFNSNICISLEPSLSFLYENKKTDGYKSLKEILKDCISKHYSITDDEHIEYIMSKYDIKSNWEYASKTNIDDYIYNITLNLK